MTLQVNGDKTAWPLTLILNSRAVLRVKLMFTGKFVQPINNQFVCSGSIPPRFSTAPCILTLMAEAYFTTFDMNLLPLLIGSWLQILPKVMDNRSLCILYTGINAKIHHLKGTFTLQIRSKICNKFVAKSTAKVRILPRILYRN